MTKRARTLLLAEPFVAIAANGNRTAAIYAIEFLADDGVWIRVANASTREGAHRMAQHYVDGDGHAIGSCPDCGAQVASTVSN